MGNEELTPDQWAKALTEGMSEEMKAAAVAAARPECPTRGGPDGWTPSCVWWGAGFREITIFFTKTYPPRNELYRCNVDVEKVIKDNPRLKSEYVEKLMRL